MITIILIIAHALSTNPKFNPDALYLGTWLLDVIIIEGIIKIFLKS